MEIILIIFYIFLTVLFVVPFLLCVLDKINGTTYSCDVFGWHNGSGTGPRSFDGASMHATCSKCGKQVMMDSQGNWF